MCERQPAGFDSDSSTPPSWHSPGYLTDCRSNDSASSELFVVRPDASGALAQAVRERENQAVISIDETIVRGAKTRIDQALDCVNFNSIIACLGIGLDPGGSRKYPSWIELEKIRYGKIIIAMDDSPDGIYVREQVLSLLYRFMYPVLAGGYVYLSRITPEALANEGAFDQFIVSRVTRILAPVKLAHSLSSFLKLNGAT